MTTFREGIFSKIETWALISMNGIKLYLSKEIYKKFTQKGI